MALRAALLLLCAAAAAAAAAVRAKRTCAYAPFFLSPFPVLFSLPLSDLAALFIGLALAPAVPLLRRCSFYLSLPFLLLRRHPRPLCRTSPRSSSTASLTTSASTTLASAPTRSTRSGRSCWRARPSPPARLSLGGQARRLGPRSSLTPPLRPALPCPALQPTIDRLAHEGLLLDQLHVQDVCRCARSPPPGVVSVRLWPLCRVLQTPPGSRRPIHPLTPAALPCLSHPP